MISRSLVRAVWFAALIGLAAGCSSSSSSAGSAASSPSARPTISDATTAPAFVSIAEPFDPGHPAQARTAPADCGSQPGTQAIVRCYEAKTETIDAQIDAV